MKRPDSESTSTDLDTVEILVVEDSLTQAMRLQMILENAGYSVHVAQDGDAALTFLDAREPTLVISDIVMPGMDGFELCSRIKERNGSADLPVILVTYLSDPADILRGLQCGADNFITKPYDESALLSRIRYLLINREFRKRSEAGLGVQVFFAGRKQVLTAERMQILDLLLSSFETAVNNKRDVEMANKELVRVNDRLKQEIRERKLAEAEKQRLIGELTEALVKVKSLSGLLPICASCKKIRNDKGYWQQIEAYIRDHTEADFSHGICPDCAKKLYPDLDIFDCE